MEKLSPGQQSDPTIDPTTGKPHKSVNPRTGKPAGIVRNIIRDGKQFWVLTDGDEVPHLEFSKANTEHPKAPPNVTPLSTEERLTALESLVEDVIDRLVEVEGARPAAPSEV